MSDIDQVMQALEARLARRLEGVRAIRQMLANDPQLALDLRHILADSERAVAIPRGAASAKTGSDKQTHFEKVRSFFSEGGNRWHTTAQIARGVGISRGAVAALLYQTHKADFERKPHPRHSRMKLWRLRQPTSEPAKTEGGHQ